MKIALAQIKIEDNLQDNLDKTKYLISEASRLGADLIVFPEIHLTKFFPQYPNLNKDEFAFTLESEEVKEICKACQDFRIFAIPNFYIKEGENYYDMSLLINKEGEIVGKQKMVHIAQFEDFYELDYYTPSEEGFFVFDTELGKIGIVICFDRHYPESIRTEALRGAELIVIPTANTTDEPKEIFESEIVSQAFQNTVNIVMCNRVGQEGNMNFSGNTLIVDSSGNTIYSADNTEKLIVTDIDLETVKELREKKQYHSLRRKEFYE